MNSHGAIAVQPVEHVLPDRLALANALAASVAADLRDAIAMRGSAVIALSGGTTPGLFLRRLAQQPVDWAKVVVTLCDERWVPPANERSNARLISENLLQGAAGAARFVPLYADGPHPESQLETVTQRIAALPLPLDVAVLGLGLDGHTASWFPDADRLAQALDPHAPLVLPIRAASAGELRMTLTLPVLNAARHLYLQIEGTDKRSLFARIVLGEGAAVASPLRALLQVARAPLQVYWSA